MVNYDDYEYDYEPIKKKSSSKKKKNNRTKLIFIFISTFFVVLISFLVVARMITPNVDISDITTSEDDTSISSNDSFRRRIDARLMGIMEEEKNPPQDLSEKTPDENHDKITANTETDFDENEKVTEKKSFEDDFFKEENKKSPTTQSSLPTDAMRPSAPVPPAPTRTTASATKPQAETVSPTYKVLVGSYATPEEARLRAKDMTSQGYNVTPFIRMVNGRYAVQVGSFNDVEKARTTANNLTHYFDGVQIIKEF